MSTYGLPAPSVRVISEWFDSLPAHHSTHLPAVESLRLFARALLAVAMEVHRENGRIVSMQQVAKNSTCVSLHRATVNRKGRAAALGGPMVPTLTRKVRT
jgi:hypothetical protein